MSGNTQSAFEYARIYDAFQNRSPAPGGVDSPPEPDSIEPVCPPKEAVSEWDDFKAEAIEELKDTVSLESSAQLTPGAEPAPKIGLDEVLMHLVQRIEGRLTQEAPPAAILSEDDKNILKEKIVAVMGAS